MSAIGFLFKPLWNLPKQTHHIRSLQPKIPRKQTNRGTKGTFSWRARERAGRGRRWTCQAAHRGRRRGSCTCGTSSSWERRRRPPAPHRRPPAQHELVLVRVIGTRWILALDTVLAGNSPWLKLKLVGEVAGRGGGGRCAEAQAGRV